MINTRKIRLLFRNNLIKGLKIAFFLFPVILLLIALVYQHLVINGKDYQLQVELEQNNKMLNQSYQDLKSFKDKQKSLLDQIDQLKKQVLLPQPIRSIKRIFPDTPQMALAIFKTESGLNPRAVNWNCFFDPQGNPTANKTKNSWICPKEARALAWSVDCGIAQLNFPGNICPEIAFDIDWNITQAKEKFDRRGWQPWATYIFGGYKKNLVWAEEQV